MKKIIYILVSIIISLVIIYCNTINSKAVTTATIYLTSNKAIVEIGEEVEIAYNIKNQKAGAYFANIYFDDDKLDYISGPDNVVVKGNQIKILWYDVRTEEEQQEKEN